MNIDLIFSGSISRRAPPHRNRVPSLLMRVRSGDCSISRLAFEVAVSGAAAVPSAFGGKAHTCYSLDITLSFAKGQGAMKK